MEELNMMVDLINRKTSKKACARPSNYKRYKPIGNEIYAFIGGVILAELIILLILKVEGIC